MREVGCFVVDFIQGKGQRSGPSPFAAKIFQHILPCLIPAPMKINIRLSSNTIDEYPESRERHRVFKMAVLVADSMIQGK
ncbi:unnamed protein product [Cercopithifilaria johnstoni]|uniref:Uncharacterized protein n=1 Tax=Cercopithifilaria johnstoni TaxID=2874296 RepID=A0A8J2LWI9_9BILA|nr:unnamed protein product [Cercopithifilaria johnstoni]